MFVDDLHGWHYVRWILLFTRRLWYYRMPLWWALRYKLKRFLERSKTNFFKILWSTSFKLMWNNIWNRIYLIENIIFISDNSMKLIKKWNKSGRKPIFSLSFFVFVFCIYSDEIFFGLVNSVHESLMSFSQ